MRRWRVAFGRCDRSELRNDGISYRRQSPSKVNTLLSLYFTDSLFKLRGQSSDTNAWISSIVFVATFWRWRER
jgi:hypothetical protein